jgi:hypothetical protein
VVAKKKAAARSLRDEPITFEEQEHEESVEVNVALNEAADDDVGGRVPDAAWETRRDIIRELLRLKELAATFELVAGLEPIRTIDFLIFIGQELIGTDPELARDLFCDETFRSWLENEDKARLWMGLYSKTKSPTDRDIAVKRCALCGTGPFPENAVSVFLEMWEMTGEDDLLEKARMAAEGMRQWRAKAQSFRYIGNATGDPEMYVKAFGCAGKITRQATRVDVVDHLITSIVVSSGHLHEPLPPEADVDAFDSLTSAEALSDNGIKTRLTREGLRTVVDGIRNRRWRDSLCERLAEIDVEP